MPSTPPVAKPGSESEGPAPTPASTTNRKSLTGADDVIVIRDLMNPALTRTVPASSLGLRSAPRSRAAGSSVGLVPSDAEASRRAECGQHSKASSRRARRKQRDSLGEELILHDDKRVRLGSASPPIASTSTPVPVVRTHAAERPRPRPQPEPLPQRSRAPSRPEPVAHTPPPVISPVEVYLKDLPARQTPPASPSPSPSSSSADELAELGDESEPELAQFCTPARYTAADAARAHPAPAPARSAGAGARAGSGRVRPDETVGVADMSLEAGTGSTSYVAPEAMDTLPPLPRTPPRTYAAAAGSPQPPPRTPPPTTTTTTTGASMVRTYPPIMIECLPDWPKHMGELRQRLGHLPNARPLGRGIRIRAKSADEYRVVQRYLVELRATLPALSWWCYALDQDKPIKVALWGLPRDTEGEQVCEGLKALGFPVRFARALPTRPGATKHTFHVQLDPMPRAQLDQLYRVEELLNMPRVTIEAWRGRTTMPQCHRCQAFGHSSANCHRPRRCVKCAGPHFGAECTKAADAPSTCANCKGAHAANSRQCPAFRREARRRAIPLPGEHRAPPQPAAPLPRGAPAPAAPPRRGALPPPPSSSAAPAQGARMTAPRTWGAKQPPPAAPVQGAPTTAPSQRAAPSSSSAAPAQGARMTAPRGRAAPRPPPAAPAQGAPMTAPRTRDAPSSSSAAPVQGAPMTATRERRAPPPTPLPMPLEPAQRPASARVGDSAPQPQDERPATKRRRRRRPRALRPGTGPMEAQEALTHALSRPAPPPTAAHEPRHPRAARRTARALLPEDLMPDRDPVCALIGALVGLLAAIAAGEDLRAAARRALAIVAGLSPGVGA